MATTNSKQMVWHSTKTIIGIKNEIAANLAFGNYEADLNTTLNAKYNIFPNEKPTDNEGNIIVPKLGWFGIGINGHYNVNDLNASQARIASMTNMDLYTPIPFVCVPIEADELSYRTKYRMRVIQNIGGIQYVMYYLKPIQMVDSSVRIVRVDPNNQKEYVYELNTSNLHPIPPTPQTTGTIEGTSAEIQVSQKFLLPIKGEEVCNPVNVLYDGDLRLARLSEYGLYTGIEKVVTGYDASSSAFNYTEVICAQLSVHTTTIGMDGSNPSNVLDRVVTITGGNVATLD